MPGRIEFTLDFKAVQPGGSPHSETCRLYLLGDFSGHNDTPPIERKIRKIDCDGFELVMAEINSTLALGGGKSLAFTSLDAFHPDRLIQHIPILTELLQLRREICNPQPAESAAAKIQAFLPSTAASDAAADDTPSRESDDDTLLRLLGKKPESPVAASTSVDQWLNRLIAPHVSKAHAPQHQVLLTAIDAALSQYLRQLLHREDFQALEALWRAVDGLVNDEAANSQEIYLVDINRAELTCNSYREQLTKRLLQHMASSDGEQEFLIVGDFLITDDQEDIELLAFFSQLARRCTGRFIAAAEQALLDRYALSEQCRNPQWLEALATIDSDCVILAYPRYLLRLPYGRKRDPIETFEFDECPALPAPDQLLWGNSALLCARALIRAKTGSSSMAAMSFADTASFAFDSSGEQCLQPGTETVLTEAQANALLEQGITPVIGFRQRQGVRLAGMTSLA